MSGNSSNNSAFGKTICSICYEDLKPLIEDLQSISICGHVFHELCLQQWVEYCVKGKKCTCPVCKQKCSQDNINRLYFQSVGDSSDTSLSQKPSEGLFVGEDKDPIFLQREVNKLKGKLSVTTTAFESQQQNLNEINKELSKCREQVKRESALKNEALQQRTLFQTSLRLKSEELAKVSSESSRLQERSMALAKELAALKLVSDFNLDEEEVSKLSLFGNGDNIKDSIEVLRKSLVLRNKSYKELLKQCGLLGRGETRALNKLEKTKEKLKTLKTRVRELELILEERDNDALRSLKASKRDPVKVIDRNDITSNALHSIKSSSRKQEEHSVEPMMRPNQSHSILFRKTGIIDFHKDVGLDSCKSHKDATDVNPGKDLHPQTVHEHPCTSFKTQTSNHCGEETSSKKLSESETRVDLSSNFCRFPTSNVGTKNDVDDMEDDVVIIDDPSLGVEGSSAADTIEIPAFHIRKENSGHVPTPQPGDKCFTGGLLGPDGGNWHLGKWCKRTSATTQGSSTGSGDLIAVGADGRGGRVKILRTQNHIDVKGGPALPKKCKNGSKQSGIQSKGCMQIEHFFAKANRS